MFYPYTVTLPLPAYLCAWLTARFGKPVRFPDRSFENALLHRLLVKRAGGAARKVAAGRPASPPHGAGGGGLPRSAVPIAVTDCAWKPPETYHHLTREGEKVMAQAVAALFRLALWTGCAPLIHARGRLNEGVDRWCAAQGIPLEGREAVRQLFYRMRRRYEACGVPVGKIFRKKKSPR